jgi:undecaprenyl diphosphate synthase
MGLLKRFIRNDLAELHGNDVRVLVIGSRERLPSDIVSLLTEAEELTQGNRGLTLVVAFNYGGRQEIVEAARQLVADVASGRVDPRHIDENSFETRLATAGIPDPDLIIRTSGEQRLSNFLLWQAAYAEFVFLPVHWPDFDKASFQQALDQFSQRDRRFGGAKPTVSAVVKSAS